ncbi:hypothetical protein CQ044_05070 [Microbacterium sp. MYb64]|nr:hypothetical protein CQ044_05070 [Microbacterium sp. MYb64]
MRNPETPPEGSTPDSEEVGERTLDRRRVRPSAAWNLTVITAIAAADDAAAAAAAVPAALAEPEDERPRCAPHDVRPHDHPRRNLRKGSAPARG